MRSTSSKGSRSRRGSQAGSEKSSRQRSQHGSEPTSDSDASDRGRSRPISAPSAASSAGPTTTNPDVRESTAESILGLWDVNRAQEKIAEKEVVRERKHRASQEGFQPSPPVVDDNVILRQRLSVSKWKGAVKAVGAVNKMGLLVKSRPPSAPTLNAGGSTHHNMTGQVEPANLVHLYSGSLFRLCAQQPPIQSRFATRLLACYPVKQLYGQYAQRWLRQVMHSRAQARVTCDILLLCCRCYKLCKLSASTSPSA